MVLDHIAAIFLFSGPLFYAGLFMLIDPAGVLGLAEWVSCVAGRPGGPHPEGNGRPEQRGNARRLRTALRLAGLGLMLLAIVI